MGTQTRRTQRRGGPHGEASGDLQKGETPIENYPDDCHGHKR